MYFRNEMLCFWGWLAWSGHQISLMAGAMPLPLMEKLKVGLHRNRDLGPQTRLH